MEQKSRRVDRPNRSARHTGELGGAGCVARRQSTSPLQHSSRLSVFWKRGPAQGAGSYGGSADPDLLAPEGQKPKAPKAETEVEDAVPAQPCARHSSESFPSINICPRRASSGYATAWADPLSMPITQRASCALKPCRRTMKRRGHPAPNPNDARHQPSPLQNRLRIAPRRVSWGCDRP